MAGRNNGENGSAWQQSARDRENLPAGCLTTAAPASDQAECLFMPFVKVGTSKITIRYYPRVSFLPCLSFEQNFN